MIQAWKSIVSFLVSGMVGSWVGVGVHNNPNWLIFLVGNHGTNTANPKTLCTLGAAHAMWNAYERRWAALTCRTCNQTVSWKGDCSADFHRSFCRQWLIQVDYNGCIAGLCFPRTWFISLFLISFFFPIFFHFQCCFRCCFKWDTGGVARRPCGHWRAGSNSPPLAAMRSKWRLGKWPTWSLW